MLKLFKVIFILAGVGFIALTGYAYLGDIEPNRTERIEPVTLDGN